MTPALQANAVIGSSLLCLVLNAGPKDASNVKIEIVDDTGTSLTTVNVRTIPAGHVHPTVFTPATFANAYCRVSNIAKSSARVTLCVRDDAGNCGGSAVSAP